MNTKMTEEQAKEEFIRQTEECYDELMKLFVTKHYSRAAIAVVMTLLLEDLKNDGIMVDFEELKINYQDFIKKKEGAN